MSLINSISTLGTRLKQVRRLTLGSTLTQEPPCDGPWGHGFPADGWVWGVLWTLWCHWEEDRERLQPSLELHTPPVNRVLTAEDNLGEQRQRLRVGFTHWTSGRGNRIGLVAQTLGFYSFLRKGIWSRDISSENSCCCFLCLFGLFLTINLQNILITVFLN